MLIFAKKKRKGKVQTENRMALIPNIFPKLWLEKVKSPPFLFLTESKKNLEKYLLVISKYLERCFAF